MPMRRARLSDCLGVRRVVNQCRDDSFTKTKIGLIEHLKWWFTMEKMPNYYCCVYRDKRKVVAYARSISGVISIGVDHEYRNKGIGSSLLNYLITNSKEKEYLAEVIKGNDRSKKMFERAGFAFHTKIGDRILLKRSV